MAMANKRNFILNKYTQWLKEATRSVIITGTIPDGLICSICSILIIEPWQCEEKRYCNSCLVANNLTNGFPDKFATKEILLLRCHCCYNNCPWEGLVHELEEHANQCEYNEDGACSHKIVGCEAKGSKVQLQNHYQENTFIYNSYLCSNILMLQEDIQKRLKSLKSCFQIDKSSASKKQYYSKNKLQIERKIVFLGDCVDYNEKKIAKMVNEVHIRNNISLHGHNIMRFDNMVDKLHSARLGNTKEFHSQPMWTDPFGYKFRIVIVYLGEERHYINNVSQPCVSIYFKLMKGEYDDLLTFPFPYPIQISIRNQSGGKDKSRVLEPDAQESFERCYGDESTGNENTPIGFSMFIDHYELLHKGFVKEDTMFLEISVLNGKSRKENDYEYTLSDHFGNITDEAHIRIDFGSSSCEYYQCMDGEHFYGPNTNDDPNISTLSIQET